MELGSAAREVTLTGQRKLTLRTLIPLAPVAHLARRSLRDCRLRMSTHRQTTSCTHGPTVCVTVAHSLVPMAWALSGRSAIRAVSVLSVHFQLSVLMSVLKEHTYAKGHTKSDWLRG